MFDKISVYNWKEDVSRSGCDGYDGRVKSKEEGRLIKKAGEAGNCKADTTVGRGSRILRMQLPVWYGMIQ